MRTAIRHMGGYTGQVMEVQALVRYRSGAAARWASGVTVERRQAPD